jgi:hypothetical protein
LKVEKSLRSHLTVLSGRATRDRLMGMSNQTNVYLVDAKMLYERDAREVDLLGPTNLTKPPRLHVVAAMGKV